MTTEQAERRGELVLANARVVGPDQVFIGSVLIRDGVIADVASGASVPTGATDCDGDYLIPGLVELHTDNLERHLRPRPGVNWPRRAAAAAHDGEFVSVGVTTLFDALRVGVMEHEDHLPDYASEAAHAFRELRQLGLLKADHYIHIRCELTAPTALDSFDSVIDEPRLRLISLMDHTIGQRQFRREDKFREYYKRASSWSDAEIDTMIERSRAQQEAHAAPNRRALVERAARIRAERGVCAIASHDDETETHVAESVGSGATIAEFPTTMEAARACRREGLAIMMGAPNLLRGFSHSGNVSAMDLAAEGLVDVLSSDYAPASLMLAAFKLAEETDYGLSRAIACASRTPALAVGLEDRGAIAPGLSADLARVYRAERLCVARAVWRRGARVS